MKSLCGRRALFFCFRLASYFCMFPKTDQPKGLKVSLLRFLQYCLRVCAACSTLAVEYYNCDLTKKACSTSPMQLKARRSSNTKPVTISRTKISSASPLRPPAHGGPRPSASCGPSQKPEAAHKTSLHDSIGAMQRDLCRPPGRALQQPPSLPCSIRQGSCNPGSGSYSESAESPHPPSVTITSKNGTETVKNLG